PDSSVSSAPAGFTAAVQAAADIYEQDFAGNYTVNITYGWGTFDNQVDSSLTNSQDSLGGTNGGSYNVSYATVKSWLTADATLSDQQLAVASLPASNSAFPSGANEFYVSSAQEKALGVFTGNASAVDGSIGFGTDSFNWQGLALTEIGHALGWDTDYYAGQPTILDLFRYSSAGNYEWTGGQPAYFSIDGGKTDVANFATSFDDTLFTNLTNDPFSVPVTSSTLNLTSLDTEVLNVIGFGGVPPLANDEWILSDGKWAASINPGSIPAGEQVAGVGDFFGGRTEGVLWYDSSTGDANEWQLSDGAWAGSVDLGSHPGNYQIAGVGDFTGDGTDDVLWTSASNGQVQTDIWELSNGRWAASVSPGSHPAGYTVASIGDFTGNGTDDILWQNAATGDTDEWQLSNGKWAASVDLGSHPGSGWQIAGVGDFTGNGIDDILWTNSSGGQVQTDIWELGSNGQWVASVSPGSHPAGYQVAGIGNFTGNSTSDILWQNSTTGDIDEWQIAGGKWAASVDLGAHPGNTPVAGVGNLTGSSTSDVLFHTSS
ncbi:MAG: NF038122 family metalloprotease, partial [Xanthobacteraceae bacterium]